MFKKPIFYVFAIILLIGIGITKDNDLVLNNLSLESNITSYNDRIFKETTKVLNVDKEPTKADVKPTSVKPTITKISKNLYNVTRIVDGDTIVIDYKGKQEKVRLIGVNTPETVKPNSPVEHYGKEASDFTKKMLTNKKVELEFDIGQRDKYNRLLAYIYLDGVMFNKTLVKEGYAQVMTIPPNVKYADEFIKLQKEARENKRGLWKK